MTSWRSDHDGERADLERCLKELSKGYGVWRKDLASLLEGDLSGLLQYLNVNLDDNDDVIAGRIGVTLERHIRSLQPRWGRMVWVDAPSAEVRKLKTIARIGFNVSRWTELREMQLMDRWDWLSKPLANEKLTHPDQEKRLVIPQRTSRHRFKQAHEQIAERMINAGAAVGVSAKPEPLASPRRPAPRSGSSFAHLVELSGELQQALNLARDACEAQNRVFYTSNLLVTLLDLPGKRVAQCFDEAAHIGQAASIREQLAATLEPDRHHEPFTPFTWLERSDVQLAGEYAISDGRLVVSELHLLLAILDGDSATNRWLQRLLREKYPQVRAAAERHRHDGPTVVNSPTPDGLR